MLGSRTLIKVHLSISKSSYIVTSDASTHLLLLPNLQLELRSQNKMVPGKSNVKKQNSNQNVQVQLSISKRPYIAISDGPMLAFFLPDLELELGSRNNTMLGKLNVTSWNSNKKFQLHLFIRKRSNIAVSGDVSTFPRLLSDRDLELWSRNNTIPETLNVFPENCNQNPILLLDICFYNIYDI